MALSGFPNLIKVVLGSAWGPGKNGLDPSDVVVLTKVSGEDKWTEDGSDTPDAATNRLRFVPISNPGYGSPYSGSRNAALYGASGTAWSNVGSALQNWSGASYALDYLFGDVWNLNTPTAPTYGSVQAWTLGIANGILSGSGLVYNADIFSTLAEAVGDLNVLDGATPIPDGTSTPVDFGSVEKGGSNPSKTFTVENNGDVSVTVDTVTLPSGYSLGSGNQITDATPIPDGSSKNLVVELDASGDAGTYSGDIVLDNDGPAGENPYNWTVTGKVVGPSQKTAAFSRRSVWNRLRGMIPVL